jgi:hypothetical protein
LTAGRIGEQTGAISQRRAKPLTAATDDDGDGDDDTRAR